MENYVNLLSDEHLTAVGKAMLSEDADDMQAQLIKDILNDAVFDLPPGTSRILREVIFINRIPETISNEEFENGTSVAKRLARRRLS